VNFQGFVIIEVSYGVIIDYFHLLFWEAMGPVPWALVTTSPLAALMVLLRARIAANSDMI
jgi:hypothetical protein